jgi:hypothetical protein
VPLSKYPRFVNPTMRSQFYRCLRVGVAAFVRGSAPILSIESLPGARSPLRSGRHFRKWSNTAKVTPLELQPRKEKGA